MTPGIICLGVAVHDLVFSVDAMPATEGKYRARDFVAAGGGMAASAAAAIARLGTPVELWSRLGDDAFADTIIDELAGFGVATRWCKRLRDRHSSISTVLVDRAGERLLVNYTDPRLDIDVDWLPLKRVADSRCVLADTRWVEGAQVLLEAAASAGVPGVLDADAAPVSDALVERASHCVFSATALQAWAGEGDLELALRKAARKGARVAAVTLGAEGVVWLEDGVIERQAAFSVPVVDTLGAGDVFHGALAVALGEGFPTSPAMRFAAAAAACKCMHFGGRRGAPRRDEVEALLAGRIGNG